MEGVLLIISSTRMSRTSVEHAMRICRSDKKPLHVAFILDDELATFIFDKLTMEGYIGDKPGNIIREAVLSEYEIRGRAIMQEICESALVCGVECHTVFEKGNFLEICRDILAEKKINHVVITRLKRSNLSRFIFGSAIDQIMSEFTDIVFEVFEEENSTNFL